MRTVNNVNIMQQGNKYQLSVKVDEKTIFIGYLAMPADNQFFKDVAPLEKICAELAKRWEIMQKGSKK